MGATVSSMKLSAAFPVTALVVSAHHPVHQIDNKTRVAAGHSEFLQRDSLIEPAGDRLADHRFRQSFRALSAALKHQPADTASEIRQKQPFPRIGQQKL